MTIVFNFQKFKKSAKITLTAAVTVGAMGIQTVNAASFAFVYTVKDDKGLENTATVTVTVEEASCSSNNGHGNNAPVTYDLGSGVKIQINQYDPSNPSGQQTSSLIAALSQGKTGKVGNGNGANTSYINLISGSSYSMTQQQATALVNSYPDWEMKKDGSIQNCSNSGVTPGTTIIIGGGNTGNTGNSGNTGNTGNTGSSGGDNTGNTGNTGNSGNTGNTGGNSGNSNNSNNPPFPGMESDGKGGWVYVD